MGSNLLPLNAYPWEKAMADAMDGSALATPSIDAITGTKIASPPPSFLPFLVYEYGLGELTPYVPNLYQLIREGIRWQRIRGTLSAVDLGLEWLGYSAEVEEESTLRRFWNMFQLHLDRVRDEYADLDRISGVARLSVPRRSVFWRGFHGFDVRPLTWSEKSWSESHFSEYSGVRVVEGGPLWSFGRIHEIDLSLSQSELEAVGAWLPPVGEEYVWADMDFAWQDTETSWLDDAATIRSEAMASSIFGQSIWLALIDADDGVIGYRRLRFKRYVSQEEGGVYSFGGVRYSPSTEITSAIHLEAMTDFGNGNGNEVYAAALLVGAALDEGVPPGSAWVTESTMVAGTVSGKTEMPIALGESIRERIKVLIRF